jgi:hypothetical protein
MNSLRFNKSHLLLEISTFEQAPRKFFRFTTKPLVHTKDPGKMEGDAIGP